MSKALIVVFYGAGNDPDSLFRTIWKPFAKGFKKYEQYIDKVYLIGNQYIFTPQEIADISIPCTRLHIDVSAAKAIDKAFEIVGEDQFLLIHPDTIIYNSEIVKKGFEYLDEYDHVAIFDGSGKPLYQTYDIFKENELRGNRCRFCNYLWFGNTRQITGIPNMTFEEKPDYPEACSFLTEKLMERGVKVKELRDDRSNIILDYIPGEITKSQWLDAPEKIWGRENPLDLGYYHIRNFNQGPELLKFFHENKKNYEVRIDPIPRWEVMRLLMWAQELGDLDVSEILKDREVDLSKWSEYTEAFRTYYPWIQNL